MIVKADPDTGDHWAARVARSGSSQWKITSDSSLTDSFADETLLFHLLDELKFLKITSSAPRGPLSSFGLDPPRFALRFTTGEKSFVLSIGSRLETGGAYATASTTGNTVEVVNGAALKVLERFESFDDLRRLRFGTMSSDDVEEIEILRPGKKLFYAQRDGTMWADPKHHAVKADVNAILDELTETRARAILSEAPFPLRPQAVIILKDRHENATRIKISLFRQKVIGTLSSRPGAFFELDPKILSDLKECYL